MLAADCAHTSGHKLGLPATLMRARGLTLTVQEWHHCAQQQRSAANQQLQQQASDAAAYSQQLQRAWVMLRQQLSAGQQQARRHRERHLLQAAVGAWVALPSTHLRLRAIAAAVSSVYDQLLLGWGLRAFCSCCSEAVAARRSVRQCIRLWGQVTAASATQRHLIRARAAARRRSVLQACFSYWLRAAWTTCRQAAALQAGELQVRPLCVAGDASDASVPHMALQPASMATVHTHFAKFMGMCPSATPGTRAPCCCCRACFCRQPWCAAKPMQQRGSHSWTA
jgi:hypothetical protein